ncbi:hypothetical protein SAMN05192574_105346 [Mucilaginibacter gossypiicola]|uniref:Uncharacterized protein n=1 Tax=Mucilaginibacter gossypiicola TaxID=551995 RepID=A0A1H8M1J1_9SPHI|nr:hypothetical protein [Mucilaginibacter gossypiicola]SEO11189.1 hypothetical protein SAMN05192574_105346 [Mucilaginibacter gossypiicola]
MLEEKIKAEKTCFIIMPISDVEGYETGHFKRVYEYIIKPACLAAGFTPIRADDVKMTNVIVIDILRKLLNSDMAICDLSAQNPNVLYEVGIRQAFDLPVSFIKDNITKRIFDIQGFRDIEYNSSLRIDDVNGMVSKLTENLIDTYESKGNDVNSIIELLGIVKAKVPDKVEISVDTEIILKSLQDISLRLGSLENNSLKPFTKQVINDFDKLEQIESFKIGQEVFRVNDLVKHEKFGDGKVTIIEFDSKSGAVATFDFLNEGRKKLMIKYVPPSALKKQ